MVELVGKHVIATSHQGRYHAQIGDVSRRECDRRFAMLETGDRFFQLRVDRQGPSQRPDTVRTRSEFFDRLLCSRIDAGMAKQSQISVRCVHAHLASTHQYLRSSADFLDRLVVKIQVTVFQPLHTLVHGADAIHNGIIASHCIHNFSLK